MDLDADMLDVELLTPSTTLTDLNQQALRYIDSTFRNIIDALRAQPHGRVEIKLKRISSLDIVPQHDDQNVQLLPSRVLVQSREMRYSWPGSTAEEAWRFACLVCVLSDIRHAVLNDTTITKRDIYYRRPEIFKKQETVDRFINDIAYTCGVTRNDLKVVASPKGLLCGLPHHTGVQSVPTIDDLKPICPLQLSSLRWVLVIEKESSFKTLVENDFHNHCSLGPGLLVTGKGYPDLSTRQFLRHILDALSTPIPIFGLVDGDPDGIDIFRCYAYGSKQLAQEIASNVSEIQWLGVNLLDLLGHPNVMSQCLPLTARDRIRARGMLARSNIACSDGALEAKLRSMLQTLLILGKKMEIQALDVWNAEGLCGWLDEKMWTVLRLRHCG